MQNKILNVSIETINELEFLKVELIRVNRRKKTYQNIKKYANDIIKNIDMDIMYISIGELIQLIADDINISGDAEDVNIFEYIPGFLYWAANDEILNYLYTLVGRQLGFHNIDAVYNEPAAEEIAAGPAAAEIINILDNKAAKKEINNNIIIYTFNNNCKIEFLAAVNNNDNRIDILDGSGEFYRRIEGDADILNYINKIEGDQEPAEPAAQDVDQENKIYYIDNIVNTLINISIDSYTMKDGGRGKMYKLNEKYAVILTAYDANGRAYDEIIDAVAVHSIKLDLYIDGSYNKTIHGAENIADFIHYHIIPVLQGTPAQDLEAQRWEYDNNIKHIINTINNSSGKDNNNLLYLELNKSGEKLYIYKNGAAVDIVNGYINILHYVNTLIANYFKPCAVCGATGEHWDGVPCKVCAGTGLTYYMNN